LEEAPFFLPLLRFFHEPSSLLLCLFSFNWKHVANKKLLTRRCSWNLVIIFGYVALYWNNLLTWSWHGSRFGDCFLNFTIRY
jgi:hypothetical protein